MGHLHTNIILINFDIQLYYIDILELYLKCDVIYFVIWNWTTLVFRAMQGA